MPPINHYDSLNLKRSIVLEPVKYLVYKFEDALHKQECLSEFLA